jgi:hypothetical protein
LAASLIEQVALARQPIKLAAAITRPTKNAPRLESRRNSLTTLRITSIFGKFAVIAWMGCIIAGCCVCTTDGQAAATLPKSLRYSPEAFNVSGLRLSFGFTLLQMM